MGTQAKQASARKFSELDAPGKLAFIGKAIVFVVTFGFAFPTIFSD